MNNQVELKAETRQMVEHSLGVAAIGGEAVAANALLDGLIDQIIFAGVFEHQVERAINRLAIDLLQRELARKPGSSDRSRAQTMTRVTLGEPAVVYVTHFLQTENTSINEPSIRPGFSHQSLAQLRFSSRARG